MSELNLPWQLDRIEKLKARVQETEMENEQLLEENSELSDKQSGYILTVRELNEQLRTCKAETVNYKAVCKERQRRIAELEAQLAETEAPVDDISCVPHERRKTVKDE